MARRLAFVLALVFGTTAAVLLGSDVSAGYRGQAIDCTTVINAAAVDLTFAPPGPRHACHDALVRRTELSGIALLGCLVAGTAFVGLSESSGGRTGLVVEASR